MGHFRILLSYVCLEKTLTSASTIRCSLQGISQTFAMESHSLSPPTVTVVILESPVILLRSSPWLAKICPVVTECDIH
ncbi:hypothetical protein DEU56DRAFT_771866 [Suillus clintonianus]|uniref:uncharacterized protein n=1 Tax=Suillus clintonianus TaxID=1904413 RepID=UPI001B85FCC3|nr:uncharacterized protein DEU56DRAFT_771866 [Suillus clintonianus]KAG2153921.1 hypothetical protein DEU56DRAFT_771866 [Suillus clintonianus]